MSLITAYLLTYLSTDGERTSTRPVHR